jgi:hypothetical protein
MVLWHLFPTFVLYVAHSCTISTSNATIFRAMVVQNLVWKTPHLPHLGFKSPIIGHVVVTWSMELHIWHVEKLLEHIPRFVNTPYIYIYIYIYIFIKDIKLFFCYCVDHHPFLMFLFQRFKRSLSQFCQHPLHFQSCSIIFHYTKLSNLKKNLRKKFFFFQHHQSWAS